MSKANFNSKISLGKLSIASSGIQDMYTVLWKNVCAVEESLSCGEQF